MEVKFSLKMLLISNKILSCKYIKSKRNWSYFIKSIYIIQKKISALHYFSSQFVCMPKKYVIVTLNYKCTHKNTVAL